MFSLDLENGEIHGLVKSQKDRELVYCLDLIQNGYLAYEILDSGSRKEDYLAESIDTYSGKIAVVNLREKRTYLMPDEESVRRYILKDDYLSGKNAYVEFVTDYRQE